MSLAAQSILWSGRPWEPNYLDDCHLSHSPLTVSVSCVAEPIWRGCWEVGTASSQVWKLSLPSKRLWEVWLANNTAFGGILSTEEMGLRKTQLRPSSFCERQSYFHQKFHLPPQQNLWPELPAKSQLDLGSFLSLSLASLLWTSRQAVSTREGRWSLSQTGRSTSLPAMALAHLALDCLGHLSQPLHCVFSLFPGPTVIFPQSQPLLIPSPCSWPQLL